MIVHCQKHQDGYLYSDAWQTIGREEDRQLAEELVKVFPAVRAVRFVPQDKHERAGER